MCQDGRYEQYSLMESSTIHLLNSPRSLWIPQLAVPMSPCILPVKNYLFKPSTAKR